VPTHRSTSLPIYGLSSSSLVPLTVATTLRTRRPTTNLLGTALPPVASTVAHLSKGMASSHPKASMAHHRKVNTVLPRQANTVNLLKVKASTAHLLLADSTANLRRDKVSTVLHHQANMVSSSDLLRVVLPLREDTLVSNSMASLHQVAGTRMTEIRGALPQF
jgi:hypothetical protein